VRGDDKAARCAWNAIYVSAKNPSSYHFVINVSRRRRSSTSRNISSKLGTAVT